jgi:hypothetical protein
MVTDEASVHEAVREYYGKTIQKTSDLKTQSCTLMEAPPLLIRESIARVPKEITEKYVKPCRGPHGEDTMDVGRLFRSTSKASMFLILDVARAKYLSPSQSCSHSLGLLRCSPAGGP